MGRPIINLPSGYVKQKTIEQWPSVEIVDLPSYKMVDLSIVMYKRFLEDLAIFKHGFRMGPRNLVTWGWNNWRSPMMKS